MTIHSEKNTQVNLQMTYEQYTALIFILSTVYGEDSFSDKISEKLVKILEGLLDNILDDLHNKE